MTSQDQQIVKICRWADQEVIASHAWLTGVKGVTDVAILDAYEAGLRQGYIKAYQTMRLQGLVKES